MIKRIFERDAAIDGFFSDNPVSCVATEALCDTYGLKSRLFELYAQFTDDRITAVTGRFGTAAHLSVSKNADIGELIGFIGFISPDTVVALKSEINDIGEEYAPHHADLLTMADFKKKDGNAAFYPDLADVYTLVCRYLPLGEKDGFIADMQARINHNAALTAAIYEDGKTVSCASVFFISRFCGFIGGVATDEEFRGRGYASVLVSALCRKLAKQNITPLISCADEAAKRIYTSLGFIKTDERITFRLKE